MDVNHNEGVNEWYVHGAQEVHKVRDRGWDEIPDNSGGNYTGNMGKDSDVVV